MDIGTQQTTTRHRVVSKPVVEEKSLLSIFNDVMVARDDETIDSSELAKELISRHTNAVYKHFDMNRETLLTSILSGWLNDYRKRTIRVAIEPEDKPVNGKGLFDGARDKVDAINRSFVKRLAKAVLSVRYVVDGLHIPLGQMNKAQVRKVASGFKNEATTLDRRAVGFEKLADAMQDGDLVASLNHSIIEEVARENLS